VGATSRHALAMQPAASAVDKSIERHGISISRRLNRQAALPERITVQEGGGSIVD
jgi:hypothetical protein